jgi:hypothetical protein
LSNNSTSKKWSPDDDWGYNKLNDFYAPATTVTKPWFKHDPEIEVSENRSLTINAQYISPTEPQGIQLVVYSGRNREVFDMEKMGDYNYSVTIPAQMIKTGFFNYTITVKKNDDSYTTYPADKEGRPFDWDFYDRSTYQIRVVPSAYPIHLFNATKDANLLVKQWRNTFRLVPTENEDEAEYQMNIGKLFELDNENLNAKPIYDYSFKHFIIDKIEGRRKDLSSMQQLVFKGRALNDKPCKLQIAFVMDNGAAYGNTIVIGKEVNEYKISLSSLKPVKTVTLPRPFPVFLPYYFNHTISSGFDINKIESIQFSIGPGIPENELNDRHGIAIESVKLE